MTMPIVFPPSQPNLPTLSVVIIGRNEGERLRRCILSVQAIHIWTTAEILYVDSGSKDGSLDLAAGLGAKVLSLSPGAFTAARARNLGWRQAAGELILFLDGDTIVNPDFPLAALAEMQKDPSNASVWGHLREIRPCLSVYVRVLDLDWIYAPGETLYCGGNALIRRAALASVEGFEEALIAGEEPEMCRRMRKLGWRIQHIDHPMALHDLAITRFSQYWRRCQRAGFAFAAVSSRFRGTSDPMWLEDASRNRQRGLFWLISLVVALATSIALGSLLPIASWLLLLTVVAARTAWLSRWKRATPGTLFLFGLHSQLQQIPIFFGQMQFLVNRDQTLIEYKDVPPATVRQNSKESGIRRP